MNQATDPKIAVVLYGNGGHLGDFKAFVDSLVARDLAPRYAKDAIVVKNTVTRDEVFQALLAQPRNSIQEFHLFCHSIGGGLYPGYEVTSQDTNRNMAAYTAGIIQNRRLSYSEVLGIEVGGILTDHLLASALSSNKSAYQAQFAEGATAKFWGCNSGVAGWQYTDLVTLDSSGKRVLVSDPTIKSAETNDYKGDKSKPWREYYWRALNTQNTPKPSIAQALASFLGVTVFGASSGAHIEVSYQNNWISSNQYKAQTGHWPGSPMALRLQPDRGDYAKFQP